LYSQDFESFKSRKQESFNIFNENRQKRFDEYRAKLNSEYAEFLKTVWKDASAEEPIPEPKREPDVPPVVFPDLDVSIPDEHELQIEETPIPKFDTTPAPVAPIIYKPRPRERDIQFEFYGTPSKVRFDMEGKVMLAGTEKKAVSDFWAGISSPVYDNLLHDCLAEKERLQLCDWAYYQFTKKVSSLLYSGNEASVFQCWLLSQSGYKSRIGRSGGDLYCLVAIADVLYDTSYWQFDGNRYYLFGVKDIHKMSAAGKEFPGTSPMGMVIDGGNLFAQKDSTPRTFEARWTESGKVNIACNANYLDFLAEVPHSCLTGSSYYDWPKHAKTMLSESVRRSLYPVLMQGIEGKTEKAAANFLLRFVQNAFEYRTDDEVWGAERAFFPEETIFYPYSDCEDRAILYVRLMKDLMGLDGALIYYPGHLAAAINFKEDIPGDYFLVNGKRYLVCDPTFINAPVGRTMTNMDNSTAKVFLL